MISPDLLELVRCPKNGGVLSPADDDLLARINAEITKKQVHSASGDLVERPLEGGLVRDDGALLYPISDGIPVLLEGHAIPLDG